MCKTGNRPASRGWTSGNTKGLTRNVSRRRRFSVLRPDMCWFMPWPRAIIHEPLGSVRRADRP